MKLALVVNPASGRGRALEYAVKAESELIKAGHTVSLFKGSSVQDSRDYLDSLVSADVDGAVVCGGDGLVHLAIQSLAGSDIALGIVPAGTGNDAARSLGIPLKDPKAAAAIISSSEPRVIDLGRASSADDQRWFLQILSTGFDSVVNELANNYRWPSGTLKYNRAMLALLPRFKPISYRIESSGSVMEFQAMLVAIANGPSYGGGMLVCPDARFDDNALDLMILNPLGKLRFLALFPRVYRGTHVRHPRVTTLRAQHLTITGEASAYADGELVGRLPMTVDVVSGALRVWGAQQP